MSAPIKTFVAFWSLSLCLTSDHAAASTITIGSDGINSAGLPQPNGTTLLTGSGIAIGQVEPSRPAKIGVDAANDLNSTVNPTAIFRQVGSPTAADLINAGVDPARDARHAMQVAGILISTDPTAKGVATGASLHSSAHATGSTNLGTDDDLALIALQKIATINDNGLPTNDDIDDVRAINHSWGKIKKAADILDGNDLINAGIDWSAREHNVLHIISGGDSITNLPVPKANFNGITVGMSDRFNNTGKYREVHFLNKITDLDGDRTAIDLIAPGFDVQSTQPNNTLSPAVPNMPINDLVDDGTSFAAPHVTGTVALLQEYGDVQIAAGAPNWGGMVTTGPAPGPTPRRHEVMKAVLMNSADKIKDDGNFVLNGNTIPQGKLLGMDRTVLKKNGDNWFDSDAYYDVVEDELDTDTPLDEEMGVGHLNAKRALQQFLPGEHDFNGTDGFIPPVGDVPLIGWDYGTITGTNFPFNKYVLDTPLVAGNFISITLA